MPNLTKTLEEKYLEDKLGLIRATIAGLAMGVSINAKMGKEYSYHVNQTAFKMIEADIKKIYKYAYKQGRLAIISKYKK